VGRPDAGERCSENGTLYRSGSIPLLFPNPKEHG
jgi:hypothetical protein